MGTYISLDFGLHFVTEKGAKEVCDAATLDGAHCCSDVIPHFWTRTMMTIELSDVTTMLDIFVEKLVPDVAYM